MSDQMNNHIPPAEEARPPLGGARRHRARPRARRRRPRQLVRFRPHHPGLCRRGAGAECRPASFADVVDKVRPAVVSVRVKSVAEDTSAVSGSDDGSSPFFDFPQAPRWTAFSGSSASRPRRASNSSSRPSWRWAPASSFRTTATW
ncbi:MAG: hypothetical protein WDM84_07665 [Bauldia sp.]